LSNTYTALLHPVPFYNHEDNY